MILWDIALLWKLPKNLGCHSQRRPESLFRRKFVISQDDFPRVARGSNLPLLCLYARGARLVPESGFTSSHFHRPHGGLLYYQPALLENAQPEPGFLNWKLTLAYDGTEFRGWQVQPNELTVQGELQAALGRITGELPLPQGSGRTDAGVHALAQVASFALKAAIPPENLLSALNRTLPASIRILEARIVPSAFHARHSAVAKTYEYRIFQSGICPPMLARYVYACPWRLNLKVLQDAARLFAGEHDFLSFAATDPDLSTRSASATTALAPAIRTIYASDWEERRTDAGPLLVYRIRGNGFLHHMVRNLVGTMVEVGRGRLGVSAIPVILAARSRSAAGPTAPARGLFLHSVEYDAMNTG
jgi:tRNA pseudouridine38-40 synthase